MQKIIKLDNSPKVKEYYITYIHISDSINNAEKSAKNKFAKLEYDSEKNREENLQLKIVSSEKELALEKEKNDQCYWNYFKWFRSFCTVNFWLF